MRSFPLQPYSLTVQVGVPNSVEIDVPMYQTLYHLLNSVPRDSVVRALFFVDIGSVCRTFIGACPCLTL